jgi:hypothetical protein
MNEHGHASLTRIVDQILETAAAVHRNLATLELNKCLAALVVNQYR